MYRKRHLPAAVAAACLLLTAAACNGEPDAQNSTTPASTPSSTPTPTPTKPKPTAPSIPAAASGFTVSSADAFGRFYISAIDYLVATGDGSAVRRWAEKGCESCSSLARAYEAMYKRGGQVTGDTQTRMLSTMEARINDSGDAVVIIRGRESRQIEVEKAGAKPVVVPSRTVTWDMVLARVSGRWAVYEMEQK